MKRALIITTISGFLPQFEMNDVKILQEYGYEIHYASNFRHPVYCFDREELKKSGIILHQVDIVKSPYALADNCKALRQIRQIIDSEKIDLVHCHNPVSAVVGRLAAGIAKEKPYVIYTAHGFHFYKGAPLKNWLLYYTTERLLAHGTDLIITINKEDYDRARRFRIKKNGNVERIHGVGVDMERFKPRKELRAAKRRELGIPDDAFHIVTAAELNANKNQKIIIEAIAELGKNDIYYSICGKGDNAENLENLIQEHHLEGQVRLLGYRTDMEEILQTADCFAFPSIREGFGIAAVEALATDVPLIVADNRGTREYTHDGYNGLVCEPGNIIAFVKAIEMLYSDEEYRKGLAKHCRKIAQRFGIVETGQVMRSIYAKADGAIARSRGENSFLPGREGASPARHGARLDKDSFLSGRGRTLPARDGAPPSRDDMLSGRDVVMSGRDGTPA